MSRTGNATGNARGRSAQGWRRTIGALSLTWVLGVAGVASAQTPSTPSQASPTTALSTPNPGVDPVLDARAQAVSSRLRCPVCQGESIQDSPAELATQMKALVREQLHAGRSEGEVLEYFVQKYGQWILLEPRAEGINLLVYGLPILFLALGGGALVVLVKRWTRPMDDAPPAPDLP